jgi:hypothetical protein
MPAPILCMPFWNFNMFVSLFFTFFLFNFLCFLYFPQFHNRNFLNEHQLKNYVSLSVNKSRVLHPFVHPFQNPTCITSLSYFVLWNWQCFDIHLWQDVIIICQNIISFKFCGLHTMRSTCLLFCRSVLSAFWIFNMTGKDGLMLHCMSSEARERETWVYVMMMILMIIIIIHNKTQ